MTLYIMFDTLEILGTTVVKRAHFGGSYKAEFL
jgi:hypothetical protein